MASTSSPQMEPLFPCPSGVNVADFVTLKLCPTNHFAWKRVMLPFLESHRLSGFVDGTIDPPNNPYPLGQSDLGEEHRNEKEEWKRRKDWDQKHMLQYGEKVSEWERQMERMQEQERAEELERELQGKGKLERNERREEWERKQGWKQERWVPDKVQVRQEGVWDRELELEWEKNLSKWECQCRKKWDEERNESREEQEEDRERERRKEWDQERERRSEWDQEREQRGRRRQERLNEEFIYKGWKRSDDLVRGWIQATVTEEILLQVMDLATAREVWIKLEKTLNPSFQISHLKRIDWTNQIRGQNLGQYVLLHKAALTADWDTADRFLSEKPDAVCQPITWCLETALIVAVRSAKRNDFVKKLMDWMWTKGVPQYMSGEDVAQDISGATALHAAVYGGNIQAAEWLLQKQPLLADVGDKYGRLPVHVAAELGNRETVEFLLARTMNLSNTESGLKLLHSLASSGLYDIALTFIRHNRMLASMEPSPLVVITQKRTSFLSGTNLNILQHLIYSGIPLKLEDIENLPQERDIENPAKCVVSALIYVKQKLNQLSWDVAEKLDPFNSIKFLRETKLIHHQALNLVKCLCEEVVKTNFQNAAKIFTEALRNATCLGIHEIVEEILESFPSAIHFRSEKDQSLFHLAIVYRRENIFNLIYQMEEDQHARVFLSMPDASTNNALHSAGNLALQQQLLLRANAPGAALQMQRELQWFEYLQRASTNPP